MIETKISGHIFYIRKKKEYFMPNKELTHKQIHMKINDVQARYPHKETTYPMGDLLREESPYVYNIVVGVIANRSNEFL
jgi:hypothetical protein